MVWEAAWRANLPWAGVAPALAIINNLDVIDDYAEKVVSTNAAVMVTADVLFSTDGPILITGLVSECITLNDATASTLQYGVDPTVGAAVTISNASASLANAAAGATVSLIGTALATAALYNASGGNLGMTAPILAMEGNIDIVVGVGSTTGTWRHHLRYKPLARGVEVIAV